MRLISFIKETLTDAIKALTSKEGLKGLYGVSLYRNAVYLMLSQLAAALSGFVFWILAARLYEPADIGLASAAISAASLLAFFSSLGLGYGLIRLLAGSGGKSRAMINSTFAVSSLACLILSLLFLAGLNFWSPLLNFIRQSPIFLVAFILFALGATLHSLLGSTFVARRRTGFSLAQGLISSLSKLVLVVVMAKFFTVFGIFASQGLGLAIAVIVTVFLFLPRVEPGYRPVPLFKKEAVNKIFHFSFTNYIADLLWMAPNYILPIMVLNFLGAEDNAYFYIAWAIGMFLNTIGISISASLLAESSYDETRLKQDTRRSIKLVLLSLIPVIALMLLIGDKLLLLFGEGYSERATHLLWVIALASLPMSLNWIYFGVERVRKKIKNIILMTSFMAVATLGLSYLLLPRLGILGGGIALLSSQGVAAFIILLQLHRKKIL